jgi:hypothetical protein
MAGNGSEDYSAEVIIGVFGLMALFLCMKRSYACLTAAFAGRVASTIPPQVDVEMALSPESFTRRHRVTVGGVASNPLVTPEHALDEGDTQHLVGKKLPFTS